MNIKITDATCPSEKQIKSNIHGTVNIMVLSDDNTPVVRLSGITLRKDKNGNSFLSMPSYKVGEGEEAKYYNHFSLFPLDKNDQSLSDSQKQRLEALTSEVVRILANGGTRVNKVGKTAENGSTPARAANNTRPVSSSSPQPTNVSNKNPWDV